VTITDLRYPVGRFTTPDPVVAEDRSAWIDTIERLPATLRLAVAGLSPEQLDTPYREGGWTVRQVVHHLPDSHMNSYMRFRLALTENEPTIRPYDEARWAELADARSGPVEPSLTMLEGLHARWALLLRSLTDADWKRTFRHPEHGRVFTLHYTLAMYAWHCRHHLAHITGIRERNGWT
jgi:hypothetical protein